MANLDGKDKIDDPTHGPYGSSIPTDIEDEVECQHYPGSCECGVMAEFLGDGLEDGPGPGGRWY